jgi:hypothetical protein
MTKRPTDRQRQQTCSLPQAPPPSPAATKETPGSQESVVHQIIGNMLIGGVEVPLDKQGRFLDWTKRKGTKAPLLSSPYAYNHFALGSFKSQVFLNFAQLPDGRFIMDAEPTEGVRIHCEDLYNVHRAEDIREASYHLIERLLLVVDHNQDAHDADPFYFMRAIGQATGLYPEYAMMTDRELRYGKTNHD